MPEVSVPSLSPLLPLAQNQRLGRPGDRPEDAVPAQARAVGPQSMQQSPGRCCPGPFPPSSRLPCIPPSVQHVFPDLSASAPPGHPGWATACKQLLSSPPSSPELTGLLGDFCIWPELLGIRGPCTACIPTRGLLPGSSTGRRGQLHCSASSRPGLSMLNSLFKKWPGLLEGSLFFRPRALSSDKTVLRDRLYKQT